MVGNLELIAICIILPQCTATSFECLFGMQAYGIRQPLDKHMTSHFPGVLAALTTNKNVCTEMAVSAEARRQVQCMAGA